jgi:thiol-disulfide isomerase/thioredoxin
MASVVKTKKPTKQAPKKKTESSQESPWYVFCSQGCGFCKKAEPVIEELNNEGYNILKLDVAEGNNSKLAEELKKEYNTQCGTPWFINAETGKGVCGYREKAVIKKWLDGEDIPEPPRPKGMPPRPPFMGVTKKEENEWKTQYNKWLDNNKHLPEAQRKTAEEILSQPRPKSEPPRPPMGADTTEEGIDKWGIEFGKWQKENSHLPNMQPVDKMVENFKARLKNAPTQPNAQPSLPQIDALEKRIADLEAKLNSVQNNNVAEVSGLTEWEEDIEYKLDALIEHLGVRV